MKVFEQLCGEFAHQRIIFDQQYFEAVRHFADLGFRHGLRWRFVGGRQVESQCCALAFTRFDFRPASSLRCEPVNLGEAQASALADRLCREERLESTLQDRFRDSGSGVADVNANRALSVDFAIRCAESQFTAIRHGIASIKDRI
jgi:hypothetical protein